MGRHRPKRWAWADGSCRRVTGSEARRGQLHCPAPTGALRAVHGKGQEAEEQGEATRVDRRSGEGGPVPDPAVPGQQEGPGSDPGAHVGCGGQTRMDTWQWGTQSEAGEGYPGPGCRLPAVSCSWFVGQTCRMPRKLGPFQGASGVEGPGPGHLL